MKKTIALLLGALAAAFILGSCSEPVPTERIAWEPDGNGYLQFRTNDENDYSKPFIHVPSEAGNLLAGGADWIAQAEVIQYSGTTVGGHGLVVGYDGIETPSLDCVIFLVRADRKYRVLTRTSGIISETTSWISSSDINSYEQINTIRAEYDNSESTLTFFANGHELYTISAYAIGDDTQAGFFNGILDAEHEGFPKHHSDRRFKLMIGDPATYTYPEP